MRSNVLDGAANGRVIAQLRPVHGAIGLSPAASAPGGGRSATASTEPAHRRFATARSMADYFVNHHDQIRRAVQAAPVPTTLTLPANLSAP